MPEFNPPLARAVLIPFFAAALLVLTRHARAAVAAAAAAWPVLLLCGLACVSFLWSADPRITATWAVGLAGTTVVGVFLAVRFDSRDRLQIVCAALGIAAIASVVAVICWPEFGIANPSRGLVCRGIFEDNNLFGRAMALSVLAFLALALEHRRRRVVGLIGVLVSALLLRGSRSLTAQLVGAAGLLATMTVALLRGRSLSTRRLVGWLALTALILATTVAVAERERVTHLFGRNPTLTGRTQVWSATWALARERLWFGHGYGTYWPQAQAAAFQFKAWPPRHPHNGYLEILFELGLVGFVIFLLPFLHLFRRAMSLSAESEGSFWPFAFLVFLALSNLAESDLLRHKIFWALYVAVAVDLFGAARGERDPGGLPDTSRRRRAISTLRRLAGASPSEVAFRARRWLEISKRRSGFHRHSARTSAPQWVNFAGVPAADTAASLLRHMRTRREPPFLLGEADARFGGSEYTRSFPERLGAVLRRGQDACEHRLSFLGVAFEAPGPLRWQRCPVTGHEWPRVFHADLDYLGAAVPDPKYTWELNRHQFLIDCGRAYRLTGRAMFAAESFRFVDGWIDDNPYLEGINWASALEVAMRTLSWLWMYQLCRSWEDLDPEVHARFIGSLSEHGEYLFENLSFYTSPFNHLVGESTLLYLLGCFLPEIAAASAWRQRGWEVLADQVEKQFHPDGGSVEQSTSYHHFTLGFFLLAVIVRQRRGEEVPAAMRERLEHALEFSMWMTRPDGHVPSIGDGDDARSIGFEPCPPFDFRNLLCLGAVLFDRADMKYVGGELCEDVLWLLGPEGCEKYRHLAAVPPTAISRNFPESGYCVLRSGWDSSAHFACIDGGPIGADVSAGSVASASHGHADLLSIEIAPFGEPIIVDPGCWTYNGDLEWHRYFREVEGHNTVRVDGRSQARFEGRMKWSKAAVPELLQWKTFAEHEVAVGGYSGVSDTCVVRHRRALVSRPRDGLWFVLDHLEGQGGAEVEVFFHLSPACEVVRVDSSSAHCVSSSGSIHLFLRCVGNPILSLEVVEAGDGPGGGWVATSYGVRRRAPVLRFHGRISLPASLGFACAASIGEPSAASEVESLPRRNGAGRGDSIACSVRHRGRTESLLFEWNPAGIEVSTPSPDAQTRTESHEPEPRADGVAVDRRPAGATSAPATRRAKILEVGPYPPPHGGWSVRIAHLRAALVAAGHECVVLNIGASRAVPSSEYECVRSSWEYARKLASHAWSGYLFHLHANAGSIKSLLPAYVALAVSLASGRRPVLTFHGGADQRFFPRRNSTLATPALALLFRACGALTCNHEGVRRLILGYGARPQKVFAIPAISTQYLVEPPSSLPAEAERFARGRSPVVLACLKWEPPCAPDSVVRALADVAMNHPSAGVIVVAPPADVSRFEHALCALQMAERSRCLATVDRGGFLALLRRADVYVRSHRSDGVSSSVAEALWLGTPVVANDGEHPDSVVTYRWGDDASLIAALSSTLRDPAAARAAVRPPPISDTLAEETELLIRCAGGSHDRERSE